MFLLNTQSIWLYRQPIDFRKQIDGLVMLVSNELEMNPTDAKLFVFRNRRADKVKILYWEDNGFWLLYKRLEKGRFKFPEILDEKFQLCREQLLWLLSGLDMLEQKPLKRVHASRFF